jgi:hypothetical protein
MFEFGKGGWLINFEGVYQIIYGFEPVQNKILEQGMNIGWLAWLGG